MKQFIKRTLRVIFNFQTKEEMYRGSKLCKWVSVKWFMARSVRNSAILASFILTGYVSAKTYNAFHPVTVFAEKQIIVASTSTSPVMDRIAQCESGNKQFAPNGQVLIKVNTNGTTDVGVMQINSVWFKQATKLGYNLTIEKDNRAFANYLYQNYGTEAWYSSKTCWSK